MRLLVVPLLFLLLAACGRESVKDTPLVVEWRGAHSAVAAPQQRVVHDEAGWQELWAMVGQPAPQALRPGTVGVGVFLGEKATAGYGIDMGWTKTDNGLNVKWEEIEPAATSVGGTAVTQPWRIAMLKSEGPAVNLAEGKVREIENENTVVENEVQEEVQDEGPDAAPGAEPMVDTDTGPPAPSAMDQEIGDELQEEQQIIDQQDPGDVLSNDEEPTEDEGADSD